jgi:hypothetical protein
LAYNKTRLKDCESGLFLYTKRKGKKYAEQMEKLAYVAISYERHMGNYQFFGHC